jgi:hypothetical protein
MVMSDFKAFQNLASNSCGVGMVVSLRFATEANGRVELWFRPRRRASRPGRAIAASISLHDLPCLEQKENVC